MFGHFEAHGQVKPLCHVDLLPQVHPAERRLVNQQQIRAVMPIESENLANAMPLEMAEPLSVLAAEIRDATSDNVLKDKRYDYGGGREAVLRYSCSLPGTTGGPTQGVATDMRRPPQACGWRRWYVAVADLFRTWTRIIHLYN